MKVNYSSDLNVKEIGKLLQKKCNLAYQIRVGVTAAALNTFSGLAVGFLSSTVRKISEDKLDFPTDKVSLTTMTNLASISTLFGPVIFTSCINHLGRKKTMVLLVVPFIIKFLLIYFSNSITYLTAAISIGFIPNLMSPVVIAIYIAETTSPHLRGSFNALLFTFHCVGAILGLSINWSVSLKRSSLIFGILTVIFAAVGLTLPETPHFFIRNGRITEAKLVLQRLYQDDVIDSELHRLEYHIKEAKNYRLKDIFLNRKNLRCLWIIQIIYLLKFFSGVIIIYWYSPILLSKGKYKYLSPFICEIISYLICVMVGISSSITFRYVSRRKIGFISISGVIISLSSLIIYFYLLDNGNTIVNSIIDFFPFLLILLFKCSCVFGITPLSFTYFREVAPVNLVAYYSLCMDFSGPLYNTIALMVFNYLITYYNHSYAFGFFLVCAIFNSVLFYIFVPETHKMTLEEVQDEL